MATRAAIAAHLLLSETRVQKLAQSGVLPKPARKGQWDLDACREHYIEHLRAIASGQRSEDGKLDLVAEKARLAHEQADKVARENALAAGEIIDATESEASRVATAIAIRTRVLAVPGKTQHKLAGEKTPKGCYGIVEEALRDALEDLANAELTSD